MGAVLSAILSLNRYIMVYSGILMSIDVYCHNAIRVTPSRQGPQLEASFEVLVLSRPKAYSAADPMPEDGMKPLAASHLDSNYFVFTNFHSSIFICFIMFHQCLHFQSESLD